MDRAEIIRRTSSLEVGSCIDRQPPWVKQDYRQLCAALKKEFGDDHGMGGVLGARFITQGPKEHPTSYYRRLRKAFFGADNYVDMEEDLTFKGLFLDNLHPHTSHELGIIGDPKTMTSTHLKELAIRAFLKSQASAKKQREDKPMVMNFDTQPLELEGAKQAPPETRPNRREQRGRKKDTTSVRSSREPRSQRQDKQSPPSRQRSKDRSPEKRKFNPRAPDAASFGKLYDAILKMQKSERRARRRDEDEESL